MICQKCKANIPDTSKFCPRCGAKVEMVAEEKPKGTIFCPKCGTPHPLTARFCKKDGTPLQKVSPPVTEIKRPEVTKEETKPEVVFVPKVEEVTAEVKEKEKPSEKMPEPEKPKDVIICPKCGASNPLTAKFCKKDGTPLKEQVIPYAPKLKIEKVQPFEKEVRKPSRIWIWLVLGLVILFLGGGVYLYYSGIIIKREERTSIEEKAPKSSELKKLAKVPESTKISKMPELPSQLEIIGKAKISSETAELYEAIATEGYPDGNIITTLRKGEVVEILKIFPNDSESRYTLKIKTGKGDIGYISVYATEDHELRGDRGAIISIHLSSPYEYECFIEDVDEDIEKFEEFVERFPQSQFVPEALVNMLSLHIYSLQCPLSNEEKKARIEKIGIIYKRLLNRFDSPKWGQKLEELYEFISQNKEELCTSDIDSQKYSELTALEKSLMELIPSSLNSVKEEIGKSIESKTFVETKKPLPAVEPLEMERKINAELRSKGLNGLYVKVDENLVATLYGTVKDSREKEYAIIVAKKFIELKEIRDNIRVAAPPQEGKIDIARFENDIRKALRDAGFENIMLEVGEDLSVTLKGSVQSIEEKNKILRIVRGIKGVKEIKDMIFVIE